MTRQPPADPDAERVEKTDAEWRDALTEEQYRVTRKAGTERAFTGHLWDEKRPGRYACVCCGAPLFTSKTKYESGSGWPSFFQPIEGAPVTIQTDTSLGMVREEVLCGRCDAHLGHRFGDGPPPTGVRYCMNSAALAFTPEQEEPAEG